MKVKILKTYISESDELYKAVRRLSILSEIPENEVQFKAYYSRLLKVLREVVETDNFVAPVYLDVNDVVYLLELDYEYDDLDYMVRITAEDLEDDLVELYL